MIDNKTLDEILSKSKMSVNKNIPSGKSQQVMGGQSNATLEANLKKAKSISITTEKEQKKLYQEQETDEQLNATLKRAISKSVTPKKEQTKNIPLHQEQEINKQLNVIIERKKRESITPKKEQTKIVPLHQETDEQLNATLKRAASKSQFPKNVQPTIVSSHQDIKLHQETDEQLNAILEQVISKSQFPKNVQTDIQLQMVLEQSKKSISPGESVKEMVAKIEKPNIQQISEKKNIFEKIPKSQHIIPGIATDEIDKLTSIIMDSFSSSTSETDKAKIKQNLLTLNDTINSYNTDTTKSDVDRLTTTSDQNKEINKIDIFFKNNNGEEIKKFIDNINSNKSDKWEKFSIIYQKIFKMPMNKVRIDLKQHLLIKMLGLTDYGDKFRVSTIFFYNVAKKTLNGNGEFITDKIIVNILTNKNVQASLESLRETDVNLVKLLDDYDNKDNLNELFKNLLLLQFDSFINEMKPHCWEDCWNEFINKFTILFNKNLKNITK